MIVRKSSVIAEVAGRRMLPGVLVQTLFLILALTLWFAQMARADITPFVGDYTGRVDIEMEDGDVDPRDLSVTIREVKDGFSVAWTSSTEKDDGRIKTKSYRVEFLPTERDGIFAAAMRRNVFGHTVQLDPMKGEPYVWGRITDDTLTVFSMFVAPNGDYEMQQYDRTLVDGGLELRFTSHRNGKPTRVLTTFLKRE